MPDEVRIAGCVLPFSEVRDTVQRIRGTEDIILEEEDLDTFRREVENKMRRKESIKPNLHLR